MWFRIFYIEYIRVIRVTFTYCYLYSWTCSIMFVRDILFVCSMKICYCIFLYDNYPMSTIGVSNHLFYWLWHISQIPVCQSDAFRITTTVVRPMHVRTLTHHIYQIGWEFTLSVTLCLKLPMHAWLVIFPRKIELTVLKKLDFPAATSILPRRRMFAVRTFGLLFGLYVSRLCLIFVRYLKSTLITVLKLKCICLIFHNSYSIKLYLHSMLTCFDDHVLKYILYFMRYLYTCTCNIWFYHHVVHTN